MPQAIEKIEAEALMLGRSDRAKVALHLINSLEESEAESSSQSIEEAWVTESSRRLEAYRRGAMKAYSVESVIEELEKSVD